MHLNLIVSTICRLLEHINEFYGNIIDKIVINSDEVKKSSFKELLKKLASSKKGRRKSKISVAGHLTVFVARTKGHFWPVRPALPLFLAVVITQTIATLIVVYGFLLPAIGWGLAAFIWSYALIAFVITDYIKVYFYKLLSREGVDVYK